MPIGFTSARDPQNQYLDYVEMLKESQKAVVEALELWTTAFDDALGEPASRPALALRSPKELVETAFDFVERAIAVQKQLVLALFDTSA
jgi:hypothetical protein